MTGKTLVSMFLFVWAASVCTAAVADDTRKEDIEAEYPYLRGLYADLHRNPELSFQERETSSRMARELRQAGFGVTEGVGGYGVVGIMTNGEGPTVMIRTDMDALPVEEKTGLPYASTRGPGEDGKSAAMHACGHDVHMAIFVGTARRMAALRDRWAGTLMMIAEPAEEKGAGARRMLEDGLYERFARPDYNLALHVHSELPAGTLAVVPGYAFANVDTVEIGVRGVGGHGAIPEATKDPVVLAAQIVLTLQTIVSREISPQEAVVVTVGAIHGGERANVIPERVDLALTVRTYGDVTRARVLQAIERIAVNQARAFGFPEDKLPEIHVKEAFTPSVYNDPALSDRIHELFRRVFGPDRLRYLDPAMVGEDFSRYGRVDPSIPSLMFRLGAVDPGLVERSETDATPLPPLHSPRFAPLPEPTIKTGVEAMTEAALLLLGKEDGTSESPSAP